MSFKEAAIKGVQWTSVSSVANSVIKLIQFAILAHYLRPDDFGLMAIITTVIGFSALFKDFGLSAAIIHRQDITDEQLSSLYWLNILVSVLLYIFVFFLAPFVAHFYESPELLGFTRLLAITFIISGIGNQFAILLQKELMFAQIAYVEVFSVVMGFIVAISLAIKGYGVYSLVYAAIFSTLASAFVYVILGMKIHKPSLVFKKKEINSMISFGLFQMGERSVNYLNSQFDVLLIGKLFGTEVLGIYSIAKNLSSKPYQIINPIVNKVSFPIMAKVQDDEQRLRSIYLKVINYLTSVNFPIYVLIILLADGIILTFFGEEWSGAIILLQILSGYRMITSFGNPIGTLQLARGRADLGFYWNLALFGFIPLVIYLGSFWGVIGVAISLVGLHLLLFYPDWKFLVNPLCDASFMEYARAIACSLIIATMGGGLGYLIGFVFGIDNFYIKGVVYCVTMIMTVWGLSTKFNQDFVKVVQNFRRR